MMYLASFHWGFLLGAALIGLLWGWIAVVHRGAALSNRVLLLIAVVVLALVAVSLSRVVPGRYGYWLDLGLALLVVYLAGCVIGSWLRGLVVARTVRR
jgi:hypothetical protein